MCTKVFYEVHDIRQVYIQAVGDYGELITIDSYAVSITVINGGSTMLEVTNVSKGYTVKLGSQEWMKVHSLLSSKGYISREGNNGKSKE